MTDWLKAGGIVINDETVLLELKLGASADLLERLALRKIASAMSERLGVGCSDIELEDAISAFYKRRNLFDRQQILAWHHSLSLEPPAFRNYLRETIVLPRLRERLVSDQAIAARFGANPHQYARMEAEVFAFSSEGAGREFVLAVREKEAGPIHGARRWIIRREAPEGAAALLFAAEPGALVGPAEIDYESYEVYRVLRQEKLILDERLKREIAGELFDEILRAELTRQPLAFLR